MKHAVISCLHANLSAVEAVLGDIDRQGIETITCLGDLVGYGPQPNEVVEFPVTFYLDPLILEDPEASRTKNVTLSYTFFEKKA